MGSPPYKVKSVAVIGAGAAGAACAAALKAEEYFETIKVFERRSGAGGTWIYDPDPEPLPLSPGSLPPVLDPPIALPNGPFPQRLPRPKRQQRFEKTPIYDLLTTNVPDIAMSFTDLSFAYGPFAPHYIPRQYIENYFSHHRSDGYLVLDTTVEDVSLVDRTSRRWRLTLKKTDGDHEIWWQDEFDALIIANGHYSIPFIPAVDGLADFIASFPGRVEHSKTYRSPGRYAGERLLVIGNSSSGHDVITQLRESGVCKPPIYVSRRSRSRWDGEKPPPGVAWKPIIRRYHADTGDVEFVDGTRLANVGRIIYCTGYRASFPFWNAKTNGRPLFDYEKDLLINNFQHTFLTDFPTLGIVGMPRVLTFRSFEYQAIVLARLWSNRAAHALPDSAEQRKWLERRADLTRQQRRRFHVIDWDTGETMEWFRYLFELAGLPVLEGIGRCPPTLGAATRWAIEHVKKYPDHEKDEGAEGWEMVNEKDTMWFI